MKDVNIVDRFPIDDITTLPRIFDGDNAKEGPAEQLLAILAGMASNKMETIFYMVDGSDPNYLVGFAGVDLCPVKPSLLPANTRIVNAEIPFAYIRPLYNGYHLSHRFIPRFITFIEDCFSKMRIPKSAKIVLTCDNASNDRSRSLVEAFEKEIEKLENRLNKR